MNNRILNLSVKDNSGNTVFSNLPVSSKINNVLIEGNQNGEEITGGDKVSSSTGIINLQRAIFGKKTDGASEGAWENYPFDFTRHSLYGVIFDESLSANDILDLVYQNDGDSNPTKEQA